MNVQDFLTQVAHVGASNIPDDDAMVYYSNFDNSYITRVGMEDNVEYLAEREITDKLTHGVGFSPKYSKWYGWSHRAIYGFKVGSTCEKGDCHYRAANLEDEIEDAIRFWDDDGHEQTTAEVIKDGVIHVSWKYNDTVPNEKVRGTIGGVEWDYNPMNFGRGEWVAKTMKDAKQMAIDFNEGVS
jgi:hypothetical protein